MTKSNAEEFSKNNYNALQDFFQAARNSREAHRMEDRILALEMMTCAIAASLEGKSRENFLTIMNSHSHVNNPMKNSAFKAVADLNVLSANFISEFNKLKNE
ncbi:MULTISPECIES: hypothetical protein [unclassified Providencia]|uniref:hypothetical protein n=1 Tax=unclassified Providencia TaxID=2633465 RepID=UPI002348FAD9|nr:MULTISPECIES: hypothetical protein [unclassified Providencia]